MSNPWLSIPLADYEQHMSLPSIGQAQMLANHFERLIARYRPASAGLVGCSGGNGLERIEAGSVNRVVGIDINPEFIAAARVRHAGRFPHLELYCADVQSTLLQFEPVELLYAALLFEYVDVPSALATLRRGCVPDGVIASVLQLPSIDQAAVSPSAFASLEALSTVFRFVAPAELSLEAARLGFILQESTTVALPSGKRFELQCFRRGGEGR